MSGSDKLKPVPPHTFGSARYATDAERTVVIRSLEAAGEVADGMDIRRAIMARFQAGEITLDDAKAEIARIKREARQGGRATRSDFFR